MIKIAWGGAATLYKIAANSQASAEERRQALGYGLSPRLPKGGQRRSPKGRLIEREGVSL